MNQYRDVDAQSDAGSERSVNVASPFVPHTSAAGGASAAQSGPGNVHGHQGLPYHMHHSLIQHLTDMRDLYGGHLPSQANSSH